MVASAKSILAEALKLPVNDRAALVENLILSLDKPDPSLDAAWLKEAEDRLAAYRSGDLAAIDAEQVFDELASGLEDSVPASGVSCFRSPESSARTHFG